MKAYKLLRINQKEGTLHPLFINKKEPVPLNIWLDAEKHPTKGFAVRKGWHCTLSPRAPHLKMRLKSGEKRIWCEVEVLDYTFYSRNQAYGGDWVIAQRMKIVRTLTTFDVLQILANEKIKNMSESDLQEFAANFTSIRTVSGD